MSKPLLFLLLLITTTASADDFARLAALLEQGGRVTIPPGDYHLDGSKPLPLRSNMTVEAYGARFLLPARLPDQARIVLFSGENISFFAWHGGEFIGQVFDPTERENHWEPNANTKGIEITTTKEKGTHDILFRDVKSNGMAGAVIGIHGQYERASESQVQHYAERVALESCSLLRSGKFMWDYGYLWQVLTFPETYEPWEVERARRYFRTDLLREVQWSAGSDQIRLNNATKPVAVSNTSEPKDAVSFLGSELPQPLIRGRQYFVVSATPESIKIAEEPQGEPIRFAQDGRGEMATNLSATYLAAYAPTGSGPGKGAFDIVGAKDVRVTGCQLSALGDTMHIQRCRNIVFANNQILGSRMGAFFLAEYCENATITGNLVDGTNGSRVVSVEKSCRDVTINGNTFRGGGRGAWINQPVNFVMTDNIFINNTTKNAADPRLGRIAFQTGKPGQFPELYFTLYEPQATYGPVIVRNNIFQLGEEAPTEAVTFAPNGHDILFTDNVFRGKKGTIVIDPSCTEVTVDHNPGATTITKPVDFNHGRR